MKNSVYGFAGTELSDSSHVHISHLKRFYFAVGSPHVFTSHVQRHVFAVGDRNVEAHAIEINGDSKHGARGNVLEKEWRSVEKFKYEPKELTARPTRK